MKKLLAVIVAALMLGSFAVTASAADLANYAKDATATEWVAGETEGTQTVTYDLGGIKPLGYFQITWGENVPAAFTVATSSDNTSLTSTQQLITQQQLQKSKLQTLHHVT